MGDPTWGVPWAIFGRFTHPKRTLGRFAHLNPFWAVSPTPNPFWAGSLWAQTVIGLYLGLWGSNRNPKGISPGYKPPHPLVVATPQKGPNAPQGPGFWPLAAPVARSLGPHRLAVPGACSGWGVSKRTRNH